MKKVRSAMSAKDGQARFKPRDFVSVPRFLLGVCFLFAAAAFAQRPANTFATFDVTGAGRAYQQGTVASGINTAGVIAGYYYDALDVAHGFVRTAAGAITTFDAVGAGTGANQGTFAIGINTGGKIAGYYVDAGNASHGFVRTAAGVITAFNVTGRARAPIREPLPPASTRAEESRVIPSMERT